jgi:hypothetical protein
MAMYVLSLEGEGLEKARVGGVCVSVSGGQQCVMLGFAAREFLET